MMPMLSMSKTTDEQTCLQTGHRTVAEEHRVARVELDGSTIRLNSAAVIAGLESSVAILLEPLSRRRVAVVDAVCDGCLAVLLRLRTVLAVLDGCWLGSVDCCLLALGR